MKNIFTLNIDAKRVYGLDILRCLAILFVVLVHGKTLLPENISKYFAYIVFDGVSIFFVLSGYLIGGILIKILEKQGSSFKTLFTFWIRRWCRTLPNYFLILILLTCLALLFTENFNLRSVNRFFFFSQNLYSNPSDWFFTESWSLSVEEWFYFLIPILIFFLLGMKIFNKKRTILYVAFSILIIVTTFRLYRYLNINEIDKNDRDVGGQVFTRLDSLMYGVIGSYFSYYYIASWLKFKFYFFFIGIAILLIAKFILFERIGFGMYNYVFSFSLISLGTLSLLPFLSDLKKSKGVIFKIVTYVSLISYSMYLLHLSVVHNWIILNIDMPLISPYGNIIVFLLYWVVTIVFSILLYKYFEVPMTKLRDKLK